MRHCLIQLNTSNLIQIVTYFFLPIIYSSCKMKYLRKYWVNHVNCSWFKAIDYNHYCWTMLIERFMVVLFSLELHLLRLNRVWTDISLFLKKKSRCLYLGASHIGHPPILRKQFLLDLALIINLNWYFYSNQNEISQNKCCIVFFSTIQISVKLVSFVMLLCYMENILTNFQTMFLFADLDFSVFSVWS